MFDVESYDKHKALEDEVLTIYSGRFYRTLSLRKLIRGLRAASETIYKDDERLTMASKISEARSLRSVMLNFYRTRKARSSHLPMIGALAYVEAILRTETSANPSEDPPSRQDVFDYLEKVTGKRLSDREDVSVARTLSENPSLDRAAIVKQLATLLQRRLHSGIDLDVAGFLALLIDLLSPSALSIDQTAGTITVAECEVDCHVDTETDKMRPLDAVTIEDLDREAFFHELAQQVSLLEKLWSNIFCPARAGATAAVGYGVWRQMRHMINFMSQTNPSLMSRVPQGFPLQDQLAATGWYTRARLAKAPQHHQSSLRRVDAWMRMELASNVRIGILYHSGRDEFLGMPSAKYGFALLLYLEDRWHGPEKSELNVALQYQLRYLLRILDTVKDAYKPTVLEEARATLAGYQKLNLAVSAWTWCHALAHVTGLVHGECKRLMTFHENTVAAHVWALARLRSADFLSSGSGKRFQRHLDEHSQLLFFEGNPKSMKAFKKSVQEQLLFEEHRVKVAKQISGLRERRHLPSLLERLDKDHYSLLLKHPNIEQQSWSLISSIEDAEAVIPDVLGIYENLNLAAVIGILRRRSLADLDPGQLALLKDDEEHVNMCAAAIYFSRRCWVCGRQGIPERCDECPSPGYCSSICRDKDRLSHLYHFHKDKYEDR